MNPRIQQQAEQLRKVLEVFHLRKSLLADGYTFMVANRAVGVMRPKHVGILLKHSDKFQLEGNVVKLTKCSSPENVTTMLRQVLERLRKLEVFPAALRAWRNEEYDVAEKFGDQPLFRIERSATYVFGLKRYGVHVNGYTAHANGNTLVWLQRRSSTKSDFPGKLDSLVGGGLASGLSIEECMMKEALEEASIAREDCARWSRPVGHVSFLYEDAKGIAPETLFCYDALLPESFEPRPNDAEVDEFIRVPIEDLLDTVIDEAKFKISSLPVVLDFLIRHHVLDHRFGAAYLESVSTIHESLYHEYPPIEAR